MLKRIFFIFAIALIITGLFFEGYSLKCPVYADSTTDEWTQVTTNSQLVDAFRYYCKSRDLTIEGSAADVITSFSTQAFNGLCNSLGIDVTALQAQIKYQSDGNTGTKFLFSSLGIDAYNRIFAQFLQDNELEVGDQVNDKTLYSGRYIVDREGVGCLTYEVNQSVTTTSDYFNIDASNISSNGTVYRYDINQILENLSISEGASPFLSYKFYTNEALTTYDFNLWKYYYRLDGNTNYSGYIKAVSASGYNYAYYCYNKNNSVSQPVLNSKCVVFHTANDRYYGGMVVVKNYSDVPLYASPNYFTIRRIYLGTNDSKNGNVYITTNNTTINNNNYEGDTIINNEGDIINNNPDNPDNPDLPPSNPTIPDDGGWQDWQLPNMPNDWLIYGMEKKFPFDIPFNILFALSLLNHEPEIPKFEGDIDLQVCTWHYDIDLTPFDGIATILRKFEVLGFIIGLAILTKNLINWG